MAGQRLQMQAALDGVLFDGFLKAKKFRDVFQENRGIEGVDLSKPILCKRKL